MQWVDQVVSVCESLCALHPFLTMASSVYCDENPRLSRDLAVLVDDHENLEQWRRRTRLHCCVRECIPAVVAVLGVAKRKRAIRDVLGLIAQWVWRMRHHEEWLV